MTPRRRHDEVPPAKDPGDEMARIVDALHRVHQLQGVITDLDALLERIVEESRQVARAEASSLLLYDSAGDDLYFHVALGERGDQESLKRRVRLRLGQGIAGAAAQLRQTIVTDNAQEDPRFFAEADVASRFSTRSLLAVPMIERDALIGVLEVVNKTDGGAFTPLDVQVMEMFSSLAATAIVNARLIEEHVRNERLAAIGMAVTSLSHYTKNIVTGLGASADLIDMGLESGNMEALQRGWPIFKRATKRIADFVQDMLSFSKPRTPVRQRCAIKAVMQEACDAFAELFAQKRVAFQVEVDPAVPPVWVDPQGIYRCLLNLLVNAADAAPEEGGEVRMSARMSAPDILEIVVEDNGDGIPDELRERIFDPFFSTKGSQGTGLGLAVTRKIALEHGGAVAVETSVLGGALFRITLPVSAPAGEEFAET